MRYITMVFRDAAARWLTISSLVVNAAMWVGIWRLMPHGHTLSPLHYTIYFGITLTGPWTSLLWLPAIGLGAIILHAIFGRFIDHPTWRRLWMCLALMMNVLCLLDVAAVIYFIRYVNLV